VPAPILAEWRKVSARGAAAHAEWKARLAGSGKGAAFTAQVSGETPREIYVALKELIASHVADKPKLATRKASEIALAAINGASDVTIGGSADLTHSNLTITKGMESVKPGDYAGRYVHYGIREHGMAAAMNGIALHGGFIPYGGTFLVFSDYARGALRLSALMGVRVIYVFTHDSIGLGEDGPTHQPVEHLATLRALPNLLTFRPADAVETAEAWAAALAEKATPSALALTRQALPALRTEASDENLTAKGAYVLRETDGERDVTLLATGSEVEIAVAAADLLATQGVKAAVVSMPCWELFERQGEPYRRAVLGTAPRVGVEAALRFGWDRWLGERGAFVGMHGFGASAPAGELYKHFGITAEAVVEAAKTLIK
jgi:transketolase